MQYAYAQVPGRFSAADERWLAALMVGTPLASLWPPGGRLSALSARALGAAYSAAAAAAAAVFVALRSELTAQACGDRACQVGYCLAAQWLPSDCPMSLCKRPCCRWLSLGQAGCGLSFAVRPHGMASTLWLVLRHDHASYTKL